MSSSTPFSTPIRPLPLIDLSCCSAPVQKIYTQADIPNWEQSETYELLQIMIERLNAAVQGKTVEDECYESETTKELVKVLLEMEGWVDDIPLDPNPQRFGNKAFRTWHQRLETNIESMQSRIIPAAFDPILSESNHHFCTSFGSAARLDYGTGHELSFLAYLLILRLVGILKEEDEQAIVTRVFVAYLEVVRKLQKVYRLEPAGSKGVWGLDDHQHLVYLWGASQLKTHPSLHPSSILTPASLSPHGVSYLFLSSILHLLSLKSGPFAEHSPMLHNIASTVPNWSKVNSGLMKMYEAEVLGKVPVVQHFWFGGILNWRKKGGGGEMMISSGDGRKTTTTEVEGEVREEGDEGTKAPWSVGGETTIHPSSSGSTLASPLSQLAYPAAPTQRMAFTPPTLFAATRSTNSTSKE